ncbi:MAG: ParB/RepB/Spo0J family partition protein [Desulfobacterales bacterium]
MDLRTEIIALEAADRNDHAYRITTRECDDPLLRSVLRLGVLTPIVVKEAGARFQIVSGFRRVEACWKSGVENMPARIFPEDTPAVFCARLAIAENRFQRELNLIEESRALRLLMESTTSEEEFHSAAEATGLSGSPKYWAQVARLCRMDESLQAGIASGSISLPIALELDRIVPELARRLGELFVSLGLSLNRQRDVLTWIREIAAREGVNPLEVLNGPEIQVVPEGGGDRNLRTRHLMDYLRRRRYPRITEAEHQFSRLERSMNLPENVSLIPPKGFESPTYTLQIRIRTPEDIDRSLGPLKTLSSHADLVQLLRGS